MTKFIRIGVISTARVNALGILSPHSDDGKVVAIASESLSEADLKKRYNLPYAFTSYTDLINFDGIDAVYISLPNSMHFDYALKALNAGKHVLCEKPIVLNASELRVLQQTAIDKKLFLMDALHYYYYPPLIDIVSRIKTKTIEKIEGFLGLPYPQNPSDIRLNPELGGGATAHLGCYITHFMTWILPDASWTLTRSVAKKEKVDIEASYSFKSDSNVTSDFRVTFDHNSIDSFALITFTDGNYLRINHAFTPTLFYNSENPAKNALSTEGILTISSFDNSKTTYAYQFDDFIQGCLSKRKPQVFMKAYELLETCLKSIG